jgi:6-phosphogluconolactonase
MANGPRREVECFSDRGEMVHFEAERVVAQAGDAIAQRGRFVVALSGGATPRPLYQLLAHSPFATRIQWPRVHVFWGDERCVPPDGPESNYRMACEALLEHVPIPGTNVHRIRGELAPSAAATAYEELLIRYFSPGELPLDPTFDLVLLGMGADGHTASLFPGSAAVSDTGRWVAATPAPQAGPWRVSLTPELLNTARNVTFLVSGADKADRVRDVLEPRQKDEHTATLPAALIRPTHGALHWMLDAAAAARLRGHDITITRAAEAGANENGHP